MEELTEIYIFRMVKNISEDKFCWNELGYSYDIEAFQQTDNENYWFVTVLKYGRTEQRFSAVILNRDIDNSLTLYKHKLVHYMRSFQKNREDFEYGIY